MKELLPTLPIFIPALVALAGIFAPKRLGLQRFIAGVGMIGMLAAAVALVVAVFQEGIQAVYMGGWVPPFGIALVADPLSSMMVLITAVIGLTVGIFSMGDIERDIQRGLYFPLYHLLLMGVNGAFLTGDLFNLYVWFEVMLIASFVLITLGQKREQLEGGLKYVTINLLSSMIFLGGLGILYGKMGTLNMADLAIKIAEDPDRLLVNTSAVLLLVAFSIKAGLFPFFFWLPASYHTPAVAVSAVFAGLLTKVGVYALIRAFTLFFTQDMAFTHTVLLVLAVFTMVTGVLGAASQMTMRKILSFHIISQIGYMILGLALMTPLALAGAIFYLIHHIIVKTNLFLVSGWVTHAQGTDDLKKVGGFFKAAPWITLLFFISAFSLGGIPPLSGFWAKLLVIWAGLESGAYIATTAALLVGALTLYSMTKIWANVFWKADPREIEGETPRGTEKRGGRYLLWIPIASLSLMTLALSLYGRPLYQMSERAAQTVLEPQQYIQAVLESRGVEAPAISADAGTGVKGSLDERKDPHG